MNYQAVNNFLLTKLYHELADNLTYHDISHTKDVIESSMWIAGQEGLDDWHEITLLKTAALFHDAGFLRTYKGHEEASCEIAKDILPGYGYEKEQIDRIATMIMATKIPQEPRNFLSEIICDADLDYLGRNDYYPIADQLFREFKIYGIVEGEGDWHRLQLGFIGNHRYFTKTAQRLREERKQRHLRELQDMTGSYQQE